MSLNSQFEAKLFRVLGHALEDPTFADALMLDAQGALKSVDLVMSDADAQAAQDFVRTMLVSSERPGEGGGVTLERSVFAPGGKRVADLAATHGDVHGDGHGDVSVGKVAQLESLRLTAGRITKPVR